jgi:hypothetical protein
VTEPRYILDTDTVTYVQAGRAAVLRRLSTVAPDAVFTTGGLSLGLTHHANPCTRLSEGHELAALLALAGLRPGW